MPVLDGTARLFETGNLLPVSFSPGTTMAVGPAATTVAAAPVALPAGTVASISNGGGGTAEIDEDGEVNADPVKGFVRKLLEDDPSAAAVLNERRLLVAASMPA